MSQVQVSVSFVSSNNCFISLPLVVTNFLYGQHQLPQNVILELSWQEAKTLRRSYVGWSGDASKQHSTHVDTIEIDPQFGSSIGLHDGQKVSMKICENSPEANLVHAEPCSIEDWEIVDRRANYLENYFIQQLRVVYPNQIVTLWINSNLTRLKIVEIDPKTQFAKLCANTEVSVKPKARPTENFQSKSNENGISNNNSIFNAPIYCLRLLPKEYLSTELFPSYPNEFCSAYVHSKDFVNIRLSNNKVVRLSKVQPQQSFHNKENEDKTEMDNKSSSQNTIYVKVVENSNVIPGHVVLCGSIRDCLDAEIFAIIRLAPSQINPVTLSNIILRNTSPFQINPSKPHTSSPATDKSVFSTLLINSFKAFVENLPDNTEIVLTNGMKLSLSSINGNLNIAIFLGVKSGNQNDGRHGKFDFPEMFTILTKSKLQNMKTEVGDNIPMPDQKLLKQPVQDCLPKLAGVSNLTDKLEGYLRSCLGKVPLRSALRVPALGGLLLCGGHGSGKTSIAKTVVYSLERDLQTLAYCLVVRCTELTEERVSSVKDKLQQWFDDAAWHAPSIILFDDLDRLIPAEVEHTDSFRFRQLAECFFQIAAKMCKRHRITIFATAQQQASIYAYLTTSHLFCEIAQLNPPTKTERHEIIEAIMSSGPTLAQNSVSNIDLLSVASECEGYLAADLKALVERTIHEGVSRHLHSGNDESQFLLTQEDFRKAQKEFVPFSLRGVKLHTSKVSWTDIGGLVETRKVLLETLEWPTKYASIFANCPLRLRSGLLLYGYPGCGKTLLASAVAKECGLNFISVKGPELLNKYIGASEKSVRDLFERAQAAKPCVLFFDEFDAIAPKRGHDSTGVTDRVVNQMLTQMDGAEGLDGVYVLAATSRPDLIDPALLRPGRLDKSLLCDMPELQEIIEILKALSRKMELKDDVDLSYYAKQCEGFSGADLQALLYNAHLEAIHEAIDSDKSLESSKSNSDGNDMQFVSFNSKSAQSTSKALTAAEKGQISQRLALIKKGFTLKKASKAENEGEDEIKKKRTAIITNEHIQTSLKITRPSITPEERARLAAIYKEFITGRNGEMPSGVASHEIGKRSTLY
ncbi:4148_t:CDS:10 [Funneliformis mosseae]|uniref:Peroxisomal ATPase PEX1 n=1 Tax=Funneliformis mosseae TaxID=27381 RepID=A0A9N8V002_FUNMO|nr:4148_t:CDS:10 [Funneliformis mosseae]